jgi:dihydrofolate reductase
MKCNPGINHSLNFKTINIMRKIILSEWISLDGHVSDKKGQLDFFAPQVRKTYSEADQLKFLETIDTILLGSKSYELFVTHWPDRPTDEEGLADTMNGVRKIVFSNTLTDAPWGKWPNAEIVSGDPISKIKQLKSLPGKNMVIWASISLAQALMKENLIDEYQLFLCPILTSGGRKLFTEEINPATLKLLEIKHYDTGIVCLHYQPLSNL